MGFLVKLMGACLACLSTQASAEILRLVTEVAPPSTIVRGKEVFGRSVDKVKLVTSRAGIVSTLEVLPWARALRQARTQRDTCVFSAVRNPAREADFKWIGPISFLEWELYALTSRNFKFIDLRDARPYLVGTYREDALEEYLRVQKFKIDSVGDDGLNVDKLLLGRIDLWGTSPTTARQMIAQRRLEGTVQPVLRFHRHDLFLACNRNMPGQMIARLEGAFASIQADGSAKAIDDKYARWPQH